MSVRVMIHACPQRMWYVEAFLAPELRSQGAEVTIWNDVNKRGNLDSCLDSFAQLRDDSATWHIQDDVLPCRDFVERCRKLDDGIVYGFCCEQFTDDPRQTGRVHLPDSWHSFQCVRIPNAYARECAEWVRSGRWSVESPDPNLQIFLKLKKGDDTFFQSFLNCRHDRIMITNAKPNLVEHIDWILGGSTLHEFRDYLARATFWEDEELVRETEARIKQFKRQNAI